MRISLELKSFNKQLGVAGLIADRSDDRVAATGIGEDGSRIAAQLVPAIGIERQAYGNGK